MNYAAPIRDALFSMEELHGYAEHYQTLPSSAEFGVDDAKVILPEIARFAENVLSPLNREGDAEGVHWEDGRVTSPLGFAEAYRQYREAGWPLLAQNPEHGGMRAPYSVKLIASEFLQGANQSWCMYTALNDGAIKALSAFGSAALIEKFVPPLISGESLATMCLSEPQCGSDLNLLRSKASPNDDGSYSISGTKIFISSGDHDLTDNIFHLVLARLPDAPEGTRGISLFVVPKYMSNDLGERVANSLSCIAVEKKMGLKASATCTMAFESAKGWLVGDANRGLSYMFVFINKSRLGVAQQAQAQIAASFDVALAYARDRRSGRAPDGVVDTEQVADTIIYQPDIQRMLLSQKAFSEGGRALMHWCAKLADQVDSGQGESRRLAGEQLSLLVPISKGFLSEIASEMTDYGIQVLGGHGYISEWGQEQRVRDVRVTRIYEGTTGIQAQDLLQRKVLDRGSEAFGLLVSQMAEVLTDLELFQHEHILMRYEQSLVALKDITATLSLLADTEQGRLAAVSVDYLMLIGYVILGYLFMRSLSIAERKLCVPSGEMLFYQSKKQTALFYLERLLPRIDSHVSVIKQADKQHKINVSCI